MIPVEPFFIQSFGKRRARTKPILTKMQLTIRTFREYTCRSCKKVFTKSHQIRNHAHLYHKNPDTKFTLTLAHIRIYDRCI